VEYKLIHCSKYFIRKHATTTKQIRTFLFSTKGAASQSGMRLFLVAEGIYL